MNAWCVCAHPHTHTHTHCLSINLTVNTTFSPILWLRTLGFRCIFISYVSAIWCQNSSKSPGKKKKHCPGKVSSLTRCFSQFKMHTKHPRRIVKAKLLVWQVWGGSRSVYFEGVAVSNVPRLASCSWDQMSLPIQPLSFWVHRRVSTQQAVSAL